MFQRWYRVAAPSLTKIRSSKLQPETHILRIDRIVKNRTSSTSSTSIVKQQWICNKYSICNCRLGCRKFHSVPSVFSSRKKIDEISKTYGSEHEWTNKCIQNETRINHHVTYGTFMSRVWFTTRPINANTFCVYCVLLLCMTKEAPTKHSTGRDA